MKDNELIMLIDSDNLIRVVVAKKYLDDNKVAIVSVGYEGGGCWSDFNAVIQMDDFEENVDCYISVSPFETDSEYDDYYSELYDEIKKHIDLDNDDNVPTLIKSIDNYDYISDYYDDYNLIDLNWDWDTDILLVISKDWPFTFSWLDNQDLSNQ